MGRVRRVRVFLVGSLGLSGDKRLVVGGLLICLSWVYVVEKGFIS